MFYYLSKFLRDTAAGTEWAHRLSPLRLFEYVTFRSAGAAVTALAMSLWLGPHVIAWLKRFKFGQDYADKAEAAGGMAAASARPTSVNEQHLKTFTSTEVR